MIQSDNGAEFSIGFTHALLRYGTAHRHSRVRRSNDQAHMERFNRTVQEECLDQVSHGLRSFRKALDSIFRITTLSGYIWELISKRPLK